MGNAQMFYFINTGLVDELFYSFHKICLKDLFTHPLIQFVSST